MKNKGFTLIELLAVIIILGILMLIAIPSVTSYINNSRKNTYVDTAKELLRGASNLVNSGELDVNDPYTTYYIPSSCINMENGNAKSPYGEFDKAYIGVTYDNDSYKYYFQCVDSTGVGIKKPTLMDKLSLDKIETNIDPDDITPSTIIGDRDKVKVVQNDCITMVEVAATNEVSDEGNKIPIVYPTGKTKATLERDDVVTIFNEQFYVLKNDVQKRETVLLTKYNLNVGDITHGGQGEGETERIAITSEFEGYGIQNRLAKGYDQWHEAYGVIAFSTSGYWNMNTPGNRAKYPGEYYVEGKYPYVYDEHSLLYEHVERYKNYLIDNGMPVKEARLPSIQEIAEFSNCRYSKDDYGSESYDCYNTPSYIYSTDYWTGSASDNGHIWRMTAITSGNPYGWVQANYNHFYSNNTVYGLRPVIVI